jgi:hypothetical protein
MKILKDKKEILITFDDVKKIIILVIVSILFVKFSHLVVSTNLYLLTTYLIILILLVIGFIALLIFLKLKYSQKLELYSFVLCIALIASYGLGQNYYAVGGHDNANLVYTEYPVELNVHIENWTDVAYCLSITNATCQVINSISNVSISISSVEVFPNDGIYGYDNRSVHQYFENNFPIARHNAYKTGIASVDLYFLNGISSKFAGKANLGGSGVVILIDRNENNAFFGRVHVLIHELGHTFGSEHSLNENEIMYKMENTFSYLPNYESSNYPSVNNNSYFSLYQDSLNNSLESPALLFTYFYYEDFVNLNINLSYRTQYQVVYSFNQSSSSFEQCSIGYSIGTMHKDTVSPYIKLSIQKREVPISLYRDLWGLDVEI